MYCTALLLAACPVLSPALLLYCISNVLQNESIAVLWVSSTHALSAKIQYVGQNRVFQTFKGLVDRDLACHLPAVVGSSFWSCYICFVPLIQRDGNRVASNLSQFISTRSASRFQTISLESFSRVPVVFNKSALYCKVFKV